MHPELRVIHTPLSRNSDYPLSVPAVVVPPCHTMFIQGQAALGAHHEEVVGTTVIEQTRQVFGNLRGILAEANGDLSDIVHMLVFILDMERFPDFFEVRKEYYDSEPLPPATGVEVSRLADPRLLIEIHATAALEDPASPR